MDTTKRPLIILGAGASNDFIRPDHRRFLTPPLTNQLIERDRLNYELAKQYTGVEDLFSRIAPMVLRSASPKTFEEALASIRNQDQIIALRFYLSDYFYDISNGDLINERVNNYRALIDYIKSGKNGGADILTFNYDTLLEQQFDHGRPFLTMNDYVADQFPVKIFKLHGSADWFYIQRTSGMQVSRGIVTSFDYLKADPGYVGPEIYTKKNLDSIKARGEADDFHRIPAIAVPIIDGKKFVCPDKHVRLLERAIDETSRILVIGWKASDNHLLEVMKARVKHKIPVFIVSGPSGGAGIAKNLSSVPNLEIVGGVKGFSNFIGSSMADDFFGAK